MVYLQDRVSLQQVNDEEQQAWDILKEAGYVGMIGKNTFSRTPGVLFSSSSLSSFSSLFYPLANEFYSLLVALTIWIYVHGSLFPILDLVLTLSPSSLYLLFIGYFYHS